MNAMKERAGFLGLLIAAAVGAAQIGASCVDGVTADCSDAATCAPSYDSGNAEGSTALPEASTDAGPNVEDASSDAEAGADAADAADGG
jgi:hypothetical protein